MAFEGTLQEFILMMHGPILEHPCIEAQQADTASRKVRIHLKTFGNKPYIMPYSPTVVLCVYKSDGTRSYNECEVEDQSTVLVTLTTQAIACAGKQKAQLYIFDGEGDIKSQGFYVNVPKAIYSEDAIKSSDEYGILRGLITDNQNIQNAEEERVTAEEERIQAEKERAASAYVMETATQTCMEVAEEARTFVRDKADAIIQTVTGTSIVAQDSSDDPVRGLRLFGRTTQDGTPTPDAPVPLVSVGDDGSITVSVTDGTDDNMQSLTLQTPNGLPGIPVTNASLANYTDADGQMWCSDEVDLERGVYVQRVKAIVLDGNKTYGISAASNSYGKVFFITIKSYLPVKNKSYFMCDTYTTIKGSGNGCLEPYEINYYSSPNGDSYVIHIAMISETATTVEEFTAERAEKPVTVMYLLATPIETPLTDAELSAYQSLHSNYPVTTVLNDAGAHMEFSFNADPKNYIAAEHAKMEAAFDAKLAEIIALLPAETQAAMIENETTNLLNESEE